MTERIVATSGIHNFRDFGGYASNLGGRVQTRVLYRSGQHRDATADDLTQVSRLGLATIVDLRSDAERELYPCPRAQDHQAEVVYAPGNTLGVASHVEAAHGVKTASEAHAAMLDLYRHMPFRPALTEAFRLYFDRLAKGTGPSLVHCLAGKDRTGLAVALVHYQLGVHMDDIMADYLLTNQVGDMDRRIAAGAEAVRANFGPDMEDAAVRTLMSVHPDFLDAAFKAIGNLDAYCRDVLQLTPTQQETLRATLIR